MLITSNKCFNEIVRIIWYRSWNVITDSLSRMIEELDTWYWGGNLIAPARWSYKQSTQEVIRSYDVVQRIIKIYRIFKRTGMFLMSFFCIFDSFFRAFFVHNKCWNKTNDKRIKKKEREMNKKPADQWMNELIYGVIRFVYGRCQYPPFKWLCFKI